MLTYQDYLRFISGQGSETGSTDAMGEGWWNSLAPQQQWQNMGGTLRLTPDDPRFAGLNAQVGDPNEPNRNITVTTGDPDQTYRPDWIRDPNRIMQGDGYYAISDTNFTPDWGRAQETVTRRNQRNAAIAAATMLAGGMAYNAFGPAAAGAGATTGTAAGGGLGLTAEGSAGIGMGVGSGGTGLAGAAGAGLVAPGGGSGAFDWSGATGATGAANGATEAATGLTGNSTIDGLLSQAASNPLRTLGLLQSLYGMVGSSGSSGGGGSSGGSTKGGSGSPVGTPGAIQRGAYQPNPITAMQLQNMRYARPRGI